jgi:YVTN family beta-propeller protein
MSDETISSGAAPSGLAPGATFAGHRIESEIGRGGMGVVYRARHLALDRERALKLIAPGLSADSGFRQRFQRESRLAASLEHPNVIPVHHAGDEGGVLYLSMRLVEGDDLRRIVEVGGPLAPARAARIVSGIAAGLDAAHARGLVHRDVKPANVLLERENGGERVFLTDFGISRTTGSGGTVTSSGELLGSADYVAPEQIEGEGVDHRADIYALGCLVHFLLTGEPPFPRENDLAKLFAHSHAPRPRPSEGSPGLPRALDDVVARAMAVRPEDRYASAGALAADLGRVGKEARATPAPAPPEDEAATGRLLRPRRPRPAAIVAAMGAVTAAAIVVALLVTGGGDGGAPTTARSGTQPKGVATIKVAPGPTALSVGGIDIWVASTDAGAVDAIDPAKNRLARSPIPVRGQPISVAVGFGSIWVANRSADTVMRLDPRERPTPISIPVGERPTDVAVDDRWVWVANGGEDTVSRVDPQTNRADETVQVGASPRSVATGGGAVWVSNIDGKSVSKIDPQRAITIGKPIAVGQRPSDLAVGYGSVWVIDNFNGTVTRIDPDTAQVAGDPVEVGSHPRGVKTGSGYVWVANGADDTVTRIDPKAAAQAGSPIPVGNNPADVAVGKGAVWTANFGDSTVTKIRP